ncbi:MAG: glycosyltransferase [Planctomycetota bacterium]
MEVRGSIADALILVLGSRTPTDARSLQRDLLMAQRHLARYSRVVIVSPGREDVRSRIQAIDDRLDIVTNSRGLSPEAFDGFAAARVADLLRGSASALVTTNQMWSGEAAVRTAWALRAAGVRTALVARGGFCWSRFETLAEGPESVSALAASETEARLCRAADLIATTTQAMASDLSWKLGIPRERFRIVPSFVPSAAKPNPTVLREPAEILCVARLVETKRVDRVIDAAAQIANTSLIEPVVRIVGEGPLRRSLEEQATATGTETILESNLDQQALFDRMRRCTAFVQASEFESHPRALLEAMACGTPIVAVAAPGASELIAHGETGLLAEPDAAAIAGRLTALITDREGAALLGESAAAEAERFRFARVEQFEIECHRAALNVSGTDDTPGATPFAERVSAYVRAMPREQAQAFLDQINQDLASGLASGLASDVAADMIETRPQPDPEVPVDRSVAS